MRSNDGEQHSKMKNRRLYQQNLSKCANFVYLAETKHIRHSQAIEWSKRSHKLDFISIGCHCGRHIAIFPKNCVCVRGDFAAIGWKIASIVYPNESQAFQNEAQKFICNERHTHTFQRVTKWNDGCLSRTQIIEIFCLKYEPKKWMKNRLWWWKRKEWSAYAHPTGREKDQI